MEAFFGGQIKEEDRGDLAVIVSRIVLVSRPQEEGGTIPAFGAFVCPIGSSEYVALTGTGAMASINPVERAYLGVSRETADRIAAIVNGRDEGVVRGTYVDAGDYGRHACADVLEGIDRLVVLPDFLYRQPMPRRIVLESTQRNEYVVVYAK